MGCEWDGGPKWEAWLARQDVDTFLEALTFVSDVCEDAEAAPRLPGGEYVAAIDNTDAIVYYTISSDSHGKNCTVHVVDVDDVPRSPGNIWTPTDP